MHHERGPVSRSTRRCWNRATSRRATPPCSNPDGSAGRRHGALLLSRRASTDSIGWRCARGSARRGRAGRRCAPRCGRSARMPSPAAEQVRGRERRLDLRHVAVADRRPLVAEEPRGDPSAPGDRPRAGRGPSSRSTPAWRPSWRMIRPSSSVSTGWSAICGQPVVRGVGRPLVDRAPRHVHGRELAHAVAEQPEDRRAPEQVALVAPAHLDETCVVRGPVVHRQHAAEGLAVPVLLVVPQREERGELRVLPRRQSPAARGCTAPSGTRCRACTTRQRSTCGSSGCVAERVEVEVVGLQPTALFLEFLDRDRHAEPFAARSTVVIRVRDRTPYSMGDFPPFRCHRVQRQPAPRFHEHRARPSRPTDRARRSCTIEIIDWVDQLPWMNPDLERDPPAILQRWWTALRGADALIVGHAGVQRQPDAAREERARLGDPTARRTAPSRARSSPSSAPADAPVRPTRAGRTSHRARVHGCRCGGRTARAAVHGRRPIDADGNTDDAEIIDAVAAKLAAVVAALQRRATPATTCLAPRTGRLRTGQGRTGGLPWRSANGELDVGVLTRMTGERPDRATLRRVAARRSSTPSCASTSSTCMHTLQPGSPHESCDRRWSLQRVDGDRRRARARAATHATAGRRVARPVDEDADAPRRTPGSSSDWRSRGRRATCLRAPTRCRWCR